MFLMVEETQLVALVIGIPGILQRLQISRMNDPPYWKRHGKMSEASTGLCPYLT
jgi:hypothetical protein